ncbi:MAG: hypothetical protein FJ098_14020, partial [Deltaproteobacteria bacterium]|nr:hypothetical protein [Deltaproteobacteria bacterium]
LAAMDAAETVGNRDSDATREDAERLMAAWSAAPACLDRGPVRVLTDRVVAAAGRREGGGFAVLEASGRLAGQIALAAFAGRAGDLATLLTEVEGSLQRVRQGLGNSRDERVLHASLGVLAAAADLFAGRAGDALEEAATAADLLDHLAAEPAAPDAPKLVRLAPALRGASLAALAALQGLTGQGPLAAQTLGRLDATLPGDLAALFSTLELPDHSDAVARILRAVAPVVARSWTEAILALEVAAPPGPGEEGWWAVGLDGGRMVAWDLLALLAWSEAPEVAKAALARGEETAQRLVDGALDHFGVRDTGWELLAVIPMAHRAVPALAAEGADWRGVVRDLAGSLEPALERALARIPAPEGPLRFTDLFLDVLRAATEVGIGAFVTEGSDARIRLADALDRRAANYTGNMAFFLGMITGALRFPASPEAAAAAFDGAVAVATGELAGVSWLPWLVEAALRLHEGDDVAGALARVDRVLERGDRALSCGLTDPVHALLPVRMWLREVAGDPAAALRDYETFRSLAERGFHGHTSVACRLVSQRGSLIVNANVGQSLAAVLVPTGSEGSFQMGAGLSSLGRTSDEVVCWAGVPAGPRDDALLHAHLAAAWYAMRRNDEAAAHRALSDALAAGRRLLHGGEVVLGGPAAAAVEAARKAVSLELVAWVSFAARLRGHITAADHLVDLADWLLGRREETWAGV